MTTPSVTPLTPSNGAAHEKKRFATVWLDGCSGCHMSFLDIDHALLDLAELIDVVYSPLVDFKVFPPDVDIALIEGAVSSAEDEEKIRHIRQQTKILVSMGDCAVTGNVSALRNMIRVEDVLSRAYLEDVTHPGIPTQVVPPLLPKVHPVHLVVPVDVVIPGCPPSARTLLYAVTELVHGRLPDLTDLTRFGA